MQYDFYVLRDLFVNYLINLFPRKIAISFNNNVIIFGEQQLFLIFLFSLLYSLTFVL